MQEDKRQNILEAALRVLSEHKITGTRMHLIAKEANVSQSILHYYFDSKDDLLKSLLEYIGEKFTEQRKELMDLKTKTFKESLKVYFSQKKDLILNEKDYDYTQLDYWVLGTANDEIRAQMKGFYSGWRNAITKSLETAVEKEGKKDEHLGILPFIIVSTMMGASLQYLIDEEPFNIDEYFLVVEEMILNLIK